MKKLAKKYCVYIFFYPHYFFGTIDMGNQGGNPEFITSFETWAVSEKQAINNVRFRFDREGGFKHFPHDQFYFEAEESASEAERTAAVEGLPS